jgi:hypothetical protein
VVRSGPSSGVGSVNKTPENNKDRDKKKWKKDKREKEADRPSSARTSLRVGTTKKGRAAETSQRRGSLKKRDRSMEKALRAEAALERKTVNLPEYVYYRVSLVHSRNAFWQSPCLQWLGTLLFSVPTTSLDSHTYS